MGYLVCSVQAQGLLNTEFSIRSRTNSEISVATLLGFPAVVEAGQARESSYGRGRKLHPG